MGVMNVVKDIITGDCTFDRKNEIEYQAHQASNWISTKLEKLTDCDWDEAVFELEDHRQAKNKYENKISLHDLLFGGSK